MTTEDLVKELAQKGEPVKRLPHPLKRFMVWAVASLIVVASGLAILGIRSDLATVWARPLQVVFAAGLAASAVASALTLIVPGRWNRFVYLAPAVFLMAWTAFNIYEALSSGSDGAGVGLKCVRNILVLSVIPALLLIAALRAAATARSNVVVFLASVGVSTLSCLATRFVCPQDGAVHFLAWHYFPVILLSAAATLAGHMISLRSESAATTS